MNQIKSQLKKEKKANRTIAIVGLVIFLLACYVSANF